LCYSISVWKLLFGPVGCASRDEIYGDLIRT
jgi:hypothetical protein